LRGLLGLTGFYCKLVQNYGKIVAPLTTLLKKNAFSLTPATNQSFQALKEAMCTNFVLALLDFNKTFVLECDASWRGIGEVLTQYGQPLGFNEKKLSEKHSGQSIYEKKMFSSLHVVDISCPYLLGKCFQIKTNHKIL
jgi:hypothetical protein